MLKQLTNNTSYAAIIIGGAVTLASILYNCGFLMDGISKFELIPVYFLTILVVKYCMDYFN
jgi:hypothetical protein